MLTSSSAPFDAPSILKTASHLASRRLATGIKFPHKLHRPDVLNRLVLKVVKQTIHLLPGYVLHGIWVSAISSSLHKFCAISSGYRWCLSGMGLLLKWY
jgi:hypothetical protein